MVDRGPLLTSAIIFYLSIGAAIFEVLEEPHWRSATNDYKRQKTELLKQFPCLGQEGLDKILQENDFFPSHEELIIILSRSSGRMPLQN